MASQLVDQGFLCVPLYDPSQLAQRRQEFDRDILSMPELKPCEMGSIEDLQIVGGGTSFAGGSICHAPSTRQVELEAYQVLFPILSEVARSLGFSHIAQVKDRVCFRPRGLSPAAETVHRDLSPNSPFDRFVIFGGWVPLNDQPGQEQFFSCIPGSHRDHVDPMSGGFSVLSKEEQRAARSRMQRIRIPLGHMLVFDQRILHEVVPDKKPYAIRRVFTAFELSRGGELPLAVRVAPRFTLDSWRDMWEQQGAFPLKSGQECRTYPKLWAVNWQQKLDFFSKYRVRKWTRDPATGRVRHVFPPPPVDRRHTPWTEEEKARFEAHPVKAI